MGANLNRKSRTFTLIIRAYKSFTIEPLRQATGGIGGIASAPIREAHSASFTAYEAGGDQTSDRLSDRFT